MPALRSRRYSRGRTPPLSARFGVGAVVDARPEDDGLSALWSHRGLADVDVPVVLPALRRHTERERNILGGERVPSDRERALAETDVPSRRRGRDDRRGRLDARGDGRWRPGSDVPHARCSHDPSAMISTAVASTSAAVDRVDRRDGSPGSIGAGDGSDGRGGRRAGQGLRCSPRRGFPSASVVSDRVPCPLRRGSADHVRGAVVRSSGTSVPSLSPCQSQRRQVLRVMAGRGPPDGCSEPRSSEGPAPPHCAFPRCTSLTYSFVCSSQSRIDCRVRM